MEPNEDKTFEAQGASETPVATKSVTSKPGRPRKPLAKFADERKDAGRRDRRRSFHAGKSRRKAIEAAVAMGNADAVAVETPDACEARRARLKQKKLNRQLGATRAAEKRRLMRPPKAEAQPGDVPRRRGRPRKIVDPSTIIPKEPKRRGRPRKIVDPSTIIPKEPKRRGRPPKPENVAKKAAYAAGVAQRKAERLAKKAAAEKALAQKKRAKLRAALTGHRKLKRTSKPLAVSFVFEGDPGKHVFIAGSFNNWSAEATELVDIWGKGVYTCSVKLERGEYQYKLVVDGLWCNDPKNPAVTDNGLGSYNNVIVVK